ncbi:MAG: heme exporter protein CcmD [Deltaproteobacteria bacterium]|nr:MAG: heme exporter protein CcmD [Deltaproteobacteria bacterium]
MGYVIAAYGLTIGAIAVYAIHLDRQRRALRRELPEGTRQNRG